MDITIDLQNKITSAGSLGYDVDKIINILDIPEGDKQQFKKDFATPGTLVQTAYKKGVDKADYLIDSKLFQLATEGNLQALDKLEQRKSFRRKP